MSRTAISIKNLSKQYRIGSQQKRKDTFLGQLAQAIKSPIENFRQIRNLNRFEKGDDTVFTALNDIDFSVSKGEVLGIIGHNGAGKSTLLKILSRITEPTRGSIEIYGRVSALLEVGTGFHPDLTGRDNVYMNGTILGMTRREIDRKFDEIVDFSGIEKHLDTPVKFYSSGMKVRLGFAVAANLEPEILIVDEVLAVGDVEFQKKCLGKMHHVAESEGRTILFVSHNMGAIKNLCNRGIVLNKGQMVYDGNVNEAIDVYFNNFSAKKISGGIIPDDFSTISTGEAKFKELRLLNSEQRESADFNTGDLIRINTLIEVRKEIKHALIDAKVVTKDGIEIAHIFSLYDQQEIDLSQGLWNITFSIRNNLQPGTYFLTLGIHKPSGHTIDYIESAIEFTSHNSHSVSDQWIHGYTSNEAEWKIIKQ
ncbi:MAG: ABC transporter ATP-binding protein [Bacteroidota bacterium]